MLDVSTAHIDGRDNEILTELAPREHGARQGETPPFRVLGHGYGFMVDTYAVDLGKATADARALGLSERFLAVLDHARRQDCRWANLDMDADPSPVLENGKWS
ncbi:hypothetical protein [Falsiroseomonas sp. HW251]|uniref:DUF5983 family protein n=1 Tax=Falsiroseomonas sp. HW251 TaxID=3390998 RepID=UPI003D311B57